MCQYLRPLVFNLCPIGSLEDKLVYWSVFIDQNRYDRGQIGMQYGHQGVWDVQIALKGSIGVESPLSPQPF